MQRNAHLPKLGQLERGLLQRSGALFVGALEVAQQFNLGGVGKSETVPLAAFFMLGRTRATSMPLS